MRLLPRWAALKSLKGWTITRDFAKAVKKAHLAHHPKHDTYATTEKVTLTAAEKEVYSDLNNKLHFEMRRVSKEYFKGVPVPKAIKENANKFFTPFTYQNLDCYGPSFECWIVVLTEYISADLLQELQALLCDEFSTWCIRVAASNSLDFGTDYELALFSDQVLLAAATARALQVPKN